MAKAGLEVSAQIGQLGGFLGEDSEKRFVSHFESAQTFFRTFELELAKWFALFGMTFDRIGFDTNQVSQR